MSVQLQSSINDFSLTSSWNATYEMGETTFTTPTIAHATKTLDLSSIPSGSKILSAVLSGATNGAGDSWATVSDIKKGITNRFSAFVVDWFNGMNTFGNLSIEFSFQAYGGTGTSGTYSRTCSLKGITLTIEYNLPCSGATLDSQTVDAGQTITLTIEPNQTGVTHSVLWAFGSYSRLDALNQGTTSDALTVPLEWLNAIPDAASGPASVTLTTLKDGESMGSMALSFVISAPASAVPSVGTFTATRIDGSVPAAWGLYVQGKSQARLTLSGCSGAYGSEILSALITGGGCSFSQFDATTPVLPMSGDVTYTAKITDSRGRSASKAVTITVTPYSPPNFSTLNVARCNDIGEPDEIGAYLSVLGAYFCSSVGENNSVTCAVRYRQGNDGESSDAQALQSGTMLLLGAGAIAQTSAYQVLLTLTDALSSVSCLIYVPTALFAINCMPQAKGVAFGKAATVENAVEIKSDWALYAGGRSITDAISSMETNIAEKASAAEFLISIGTTWTGSAAPYTQVISVSGVLATDNPVAGLVHGSDTTAWDAEDAAWSAVRDIVTADGSVTVYAGSQTATAITVRLKEVRG